MSATMEPRPVGQENLAAKLEFSKQLQALTNRIHAAANVEEIMLEVSQDLCNLLEADRLTIYITSEDRQTIVSKVKTGLASFKELKLPINDQSVAGYVAVHRRPLNLKDVYDDQDLKSQKPAVHFLKEVDKRTGYRTRQMLVAPIIDSAGQELLGVIQLINTKSGGPFARAAEEGVASVAETLAIALRHRNKAQQLFRGKFDHLVVNAAISADELELATRSARRKNLEVEDVLIDEFQVKADIVGNALSEFFGAPYQNYKPDTVKPMDLLRNLNRNYLEENQWLPIEDSKDGILVVSNDPDRVRSARIVNNVFPKSKILYRVTTRREFVNYLDLFYGGGIADSGDIGDILDGLTEDGDLESQDVDGIDQAQDNEVVKLVNKIIIDAFHQGASDIHIEPYPGKGKTEVRFRKDGTLFPYISVPSSYRAAIAARLKIMCDLDIAERRKPQDGKIKFKRFGPLDIELRVATIPSQGGLEDIVMRILAAGEPIPLDKLALSERNAETLKDCISKPYGLFFVCGPTGSGKTTTLHSVLGYLNTPETKIWTAEDPVEITQRGLRQVQMNVKAGLNFATAMRAFLRADPDIIMVGEMRDKETTAIGIEASLTGHLVFATLHTNSATESIVRLLDMGMDPFNFADALLGVLAQRLAKRLCSKCKKARIAGQDEVKMMLEEYCQELRNTLYWKADPKGAYEEIYKEWVKSFADERGQFTVHAPVGCEACNSTGYRGRVGLHELLVGSDAVKKHIQEHSRVADMLLTALEEGMRTLKQDGIEKVLQGITDMHQVRAVCIK